MNVSVEPTRIEPVPSPMETTTAPPIAISSIIVSMTLMALASGHMFTYLPVKLAEAGFASWVAGTLMVALAGGGFIGCLVTGWLIRNSGHARVFATLCAANILSFVLIAWSVDPYVWIASRIVYGFAVSGLFIVSQSWLHDASPDRWRGRVMGIFYMSYVLGIGGGSFLMRFVPLDGHGAVFIAISFATLAVFPVGMTQLPPPPPPPIGSINLRKVWKFAPTGLLGMITVGGLTMMVQGFAPIYATSTGYAKNDVALLMALMQVGMVAIQLPLGAASDLVDRRWVLLATSILVVGGAAVALGLQGVSLIWLIVIFAVWSGATETIYSVSNAQANDQADPADYVMLSSTLLFAWSASAFALPLIATFATGLYGPTAFMWIAIAVSAAFGVFLVWRLSARPYEVEDDREPFQPVTAQVPYAREPFEAE